MNTRNCLFVLGFALVVVACGDDDTTTNNANSPFNPTNSPDAAAPTNNTPGSSADGGDACGTPAGCFCGTPTSQAQFLNRCTKSAALPVTETVKAATIANIP